MTSTWTRIHEHLGLRPGPLSFEHVAAAAADALSEADVLDWKEALPQPPRDGAWNEFAKDVTAMANTRGGLLIYGVTDDHRLEGIDADAVDDRQYGQWLRNHVRPFLADVRCTVLRSPDAAKAVLVVEVPASELAPHSVMGTSARDKQQNAFVVPYRDGDHTAWMEEHQIARVYRDRFTAQERYGEELRNLWDSTHALVVQPGVHQGWAIFAAQPVRQVPRLAGRIDRTDVAHILERALEDSASLRTRPGFGVQALRNLGDQRHNARVGLRSWVVSNTLAAADSNGLRPVYLQLGHDGTVAFAVHVSWKTMEDRPIDLKVVVNAEAVDVAAGEFLVLAQLLNLHLHHDSPIGVRAGIGGGVEPTWKYFCAERNDISQFAKSDRSRELHRIQPWITEISAAAAVEETRESAENLSSAMLNQFGVVSQLYRSS
ncbi:helix-turn-helix domain-containing protein [Amycolatopsis sp. NPDC051758]|uniref:helix-turn-helix domain-containing protein n=1 Tax=Amycolatopsis sp. NPDC051758 TaxID=3363935 RepID=UPI0037AA373E